MATKIPKELIYPTQVITFGPPFAFYTAVGVTAVIRTTVFQRRFLINQDYNYSSVLEENNTFEIYLTSNLFPGESQVFNKKIVIMPGGALIAYSLSAGTPVPTVGAWGYEIS